MNHFTSRTNRHVRLLHWMPHVLCACLILFSRNLVAQSTSVRVVQWDLEEVEGFLELIDEERVSIRGIDDMNTMIEPDRIAFIEFTGTIQKAQGKGGSRNGLLWLVDGTRYTGWSEVEDGRFVWRNWWAGTVRPRLDDIFAFVENGRTEPVHASDEDIVLLRNGDVLKGLIDSIGEEVAVERPDGNMSTVSLDRVESVSLVNTIRPGSGARAWLTPGDEVELSSFRFDAGTGLRIEGREPLMPTHMEAMAFDSSRITPLAGLEPRIDALAESPRYRIPGPAIMQGSWPLDAPPIELRGPLRADWTLPRPGMSLHVKVSLPRSDRRHGRVELSILDGGEQVWSSTLDHDRPTTTISLPMSTDQLSMELREAGTGPIQNAVRLERAVLFDSR